MLLKLNGVVQIVKLELYYPFVVNQINVKIAYVDLNFLSELLDQLNLTKILHSIYLELRDSGGHKLGSLLVWHFNDLFGLVLVPFVLVAVPLRL